MLQLHSALKAAASWGCCAVLPCLRDAEAWHQHNGFVKNRVCYANAH